MMPKILFHYTSLDTFLKIIESQKIRLSDLSQSNDAFEGKFLEARLFAAIEHSRIAVEYHETLKEILTDHFDYSGAFGFCLSESSDQLSQWRGYGDDGYGVCLGFDSTKLENAVRNTDHDLRHAKLVKVGYGEQSAAAITTRIIAELEALNLDPDELSAFEANVAEFLLISAPNEQTGISPATSAWIALLNGSFHGYEFKSASFDEEKEHRILVVKSNKIETHTKYWVRRNRLVGYLDVDVQDSLKQVIIGPKCEVTVKEMRRALRTYHDGNPFRFINSIERSEISYR